MAKQAAPHSSASICMITGTFATPLVRGALIFSVFFMAMPQFSANFMGAMLSMRMDAP